MEQRRVLGPDEVGAGPGQSFGEKTDQDYQNEGAARAERDGFGDSGTIDSLRQGMRLRATAEGVPQRPRQQDESQRRRHQVQGDPGRGVDAQADPQRVHGRRARR